ncbi:DNA methylase [Bacillus thuringiensis]|uniref:DNA (cytosine-5-)-methyltransferase n=2 Tax=Bacillus thuringiensis TaxID=1428 RepID=A0A9W3PFA0_BACTU|nr:phage-related DNA methylase, N-terminal region [Bacillus thuringiensis YBT-1518]EKS8365499.1 DNA (cytosine-5-)-methyltransferase [Bacillus cereus]MBG9482085.1 DNA methylase [Bacillus thuringiensis]MBG9511889.1 DNA methylase [Bacillus thuringiensis]
MSLTFIDLFAGVGMTRIGFEQAGHVCKGFVEWDDSARRAYIAMHHSEKEWNVVDIKDAKGVDIPTVDVWTAGFPCTDISKNGKQKGLAGEQSGLFTEVIRLIKEVPEYKKPSYLFIENVDNTLSVNKGWDFARILSMLDANGYDAEWDVITSTEVGIPQRRKRIFIVGYLRGRRIKRVFS